MSKAEELLNDIGTGSELSEGNASYRTKWTNSAKKFATGMAKVKMRAGFTHIVYPPQAQARAWDPIYVKFKKEGDKINKEELNGKGEVVDLNKMF